MKKRPLARLRMKAEALGHVALDASVGYAHDFIDSRRPISAIGETARASHGGNEATAALQVSTRLHAAGFTFVPRAGIDYAHLSESAIGETGAPGVNLAVASRDSNSLRPFIGASASRTFVAGGVTLVPRVDLTYSHETMNAAPANIVTVGGGSFSVAGLTPSRDAVTAGAGFSAVMSSRLTLYTRYSATLPTGNLFAQTVSAGLRYRF